VHRTLPGVEEAMKWSMPHFILGGKNVAGMSAFKAHCGFVIHGETKPGDTEGKGMGMGAFGKIASLDDLPDEAELVAKLKAAAQRIQTVGTALKTGAKRAPKADIAMPEDFAAALAANPRAQATLDGFPPGQRREYLEWITTAKQAQTREKRIAQAVEWLAEGKKRNWKYDSC
jgi:uncharacterized protein YdeI (YjbR/CyaY-like superfamily)